MNRIGLGAITTAFFLTIAAEAVGQSNDIWEQLPKSQPPYDYDKRTPAPVNPKNTDKSNVKILRFDSTAINDYLSDGDFAYDRPPVSSESLVKRFMRRLYRFLRELLGDSDDNQWIEKLFYGLAALILAFVIARLAGLKPQLFIRTERRTADEYSVGEENIHTIDFEREIARAEAQGNLRRAVRLHYLQLLKHLHDRNIIAWRASKTNMEYVAETSAEPFGADFARLTRYFTFVWYGDFEVKPTAYQLFKQDKQALIARTAARQPANA